MVAARPGNRQPLRALLAKGANPDARGPRGQTALMWAVAQKHAEVVRLLARARSRRAVRTESWSQMMAVPRTAFPNTTG